MIFTPALRQAYRHAFEQNDGTALGFHAAATAMLSQIRTSEDTSSDRFGAMCLLCLVDDFSAEHLIAAFEQEVEACLPKANLTHAVWAKIGAMIYDCLEDHITDRQRQRIEIQQSLLANALLTVGKGNPHHVINNWWAVTHSGLVLAALCLPASLQREEVLTFASHRLKAFLHHFGPAGYYHEGLGYEDYTLSQVLPALYALSAAGLFDFETDFPQITNLAHSLLIPSAAIPALANRTDTDPAWGGYLCWNDAGHVWPGSNVAGLSIHLSKQAAALWTWFQKLAGAESPDQNFAPNRCGLYDNALVYPYGSPLAPTSSLKTHCLDTRQGLMVYRNQWQNADDLIVGLYARATHVGGHSQDDAGSLRVMGMGYDWILGGGQNRPDAVWQSLVTPVIESPAAKAACGAILYEEFLPDGFCLGLDLRKPRGAYYERYVRFISNPVENVEGALLILDQIDEHRDLPWGFNLTLSPQHKIHQHPHGITLTAPDHSCMHLYFFTQPDALTFTELPTSTRTYANGNKEQYLGFPVLKAHFNPKPHLGIYTLITFSKSGHIPVPQPGEGLAFQLDGTRISRPFAAAVSEKYMPGISKGLCQEPLLYID